MESWSRAPASRAWARSPHEKRSRRAACRPRMSRFTLRVWQGALTVENSRRQCPTGSREASCDERRHRGGRMARTLADRVAQLEWYHTLNLPGGVFTKGFFDHRPVLDRYCLPPTFSGHRVLDVGTFDGFFAFEFERRESPTAGWSLRPSHCFPDCARALC